MKEITQEERDEVLKGLRLAGRPLLEAWVLHPEDDTPLLLPDADDDEAHETADGRVMVIHGSRVTFYPAHRVLSTEMHLDDIVRSAYKMQEAMRERSNIVTPAPTSKGVM